MTPPLDSALKLTKLRAEIAGHASNEWARSLGYSPLFTASEKSKIVIVGQAPGRKAQESGVPWDDASGVKLRAWLGVTAAQFYDPDCFALLPMDFYFPGKGASGDLPPRKEFAGQWHPKILENMPQRGLTLLIGSYSQRHYLAGRTQANLTLTVQAYREYLPEYLPLVHPSPLNFRWQGKNPWFEEDLVPELQRIVDSVL